MEFLPGIHSLKTTMGPRPLYIYILRGERTILIDTGLPDTPSKVIFPYLREIGVDPAHVDMAIVTHGDVDHFGGNYDLKQTAPRCVIASHRIDMDWASDKEITKAERYQMFEQDHGVGYDSDTLAWIMDLAGPAVPLDLGFNGGELVRIGPNWTVEILHAPGHTPGHLIVWDEKNRGVFMGEAALSRGLCDNEGRFSSPPPYYDRDAYLGTLDLLTRLQPKVLFNTHFGIMEGEAASLFLTESRDYVERAEAAVVSSLRQASNTGRTLKELCAELNPVLGPYDSAEELGPVVTGHLKSKEAAGEVELRTADRSYPRWVLR